MLLQLHSGIAEVAAAKARMFINKPDGSKSLRLFTDMLVQDKIVADILSLLWTSLLILAVIREDRGPYSDPQHPYLYEEEDVWMAPGFINQFYEVTLILRWEIY